MEQPNCYSRRIIWRRNTANQSDLNKQEIVGKEMKPLGYNECEEYIDTPRIYGQHAPFWSSLSFFEKVDTIRHVGLFSFLREIFGFADADRIRRRLESEYSATLRDCEAAQDQISALIQKNEELERELAETTEKLKEAECASRGRNHRLLTPPSAQDIMNAFNRSSESETKPWFFRYYEDPHTGVVTLNHDFRFYPFPAIIVPRGKLRLCDQYGSVVNLAQCESYAALPPKYVQHLIPEGFHAYRLRVLFVTRERGFWLADPRSAQDIALEIRASFDEGADHALYDNRIKYWKERHSEHQAMTCGTRRETFFNLIISIEELLCGGCNNFSQEQIKRIMDKCYAEYLDIYFKDKYNEE